MSSRGRLVLDVKDRGLVIDPKLAKDDGALTSGRRWATPIPRLETSGAAGCTRRPMCSQTPKPMQPEAKNKLNQLRIAVVPLLQHFNACGNAALKLLHCDELLSWELPILMGSFNNGEMEWRRPVNFVAGTCYIRGASPPVKHSHLTETIWARAFVSLKFR